MNATLDNLVRSAQRSIRSKQQANQNLRQRIDSLENRSRPLIPLPAGTADD